jgi:exonuclease SbcC
MWTPVQLYIENLASHEKTSFQFQGGRVVVIQGENHDKHTGQESNGSGKSALIEGIAVALAGVSFRKVRAAELVRNGQDALRVVMSLRNQRLRVQTEREAESTVIPPEHRGYASVMEIERVIYANTKASQVKVKLNGQPVSRLTSVDEANEFILSQLGVSKEDLLNYFLVSKEKFCSFFDTADAKKKQLINRFSGADRLDQLAPQLDKKLADAEHCVSKFAMWENEARTRVNVYTEELTAARLRSPEKQREEELGVLYEQANQLEADYKQTKREHVDALKAENVVQAELVALGSDNSEQLVTELNKDSEGVLAEVARLQAVVRAVEGPGSEWHGERMAINEKREGFFAELREYKATLKEILDFEADLQKTIRGSVECPKCEHPFSLAEPGADIAEAHTDLKQVEEVLLPNANRQIDRLNLAVLAADKEMDEARVRMEQRRRVAGEELETYRTTYEAPLQARGEAIRQTTQKYYADLRAINARLSPAQSLVSSLKLKVERIHQALGDVNTKIEKKQGEQLEDLIGPLASKLEAAQQKLAEMEEEHGKAKEIRDKAGAWPVRMKQFKSYLANQLLDTLSGYTNLFLEKIGSDLQIELEGYRLLADRKTIKEELTAKLLRGGEDAGSFHKYSGGEKGRVDFCQILAVQQLINLNAPTGGLNLLVTDEILESVDSRGVHELARKLDNLDKTIMLVTHAGADVPFPNRLLVEKRNGVSSLAAA